jgi:hypothetical protein
VGDPRNLAMPDFWRNSGFHLLERAAGRLVITDDFLRAYLLRPEIRPIDESGPAEVALHEALMENPRRSVSEEELTAIEDDDTRSNYRVLLAFFERLRRASSVEACYVDLFGAGGVTVPPLFIDQLVQVILRGILDDVADSFEARAAELFFREQKAGIEQGQIMLADLETVELHASGGALGSIGRLIVEAQAAVRSMNLEVLNADNAALYWSRSERHDFGDRFFRREFFAFGKADHAAIRE